MITALRRSHAMRSQSPVFIVGCPRSGTSVLYRSLLQHPSFAIGRPDYTESHAVQALTLERDIGGLEPRLRAFLGRDADTAWDDFVRSVAMLRRWRRVIWPMTHRWATHPIVWRTSGSAITLRAYFDAAARARGGHRVVEKTPENLAVSPLLRTAFPKAKLVAIIREPVATLASYRRRYATDPSAAWANVSIDAFCSLWADNAALALRWRERWPDSFHFVTYEAFTDAPETTFAALCAFLGEPGDDAALRGRHESTSTIEPLLFDDIQPSGRNTATTYVSAEEAAQLYARLTEPMAMLGYRG